MRQFMHFKNLNERVTDILYLFFLKEIPGSKDFESYRLLHSIVNLSLMIIIIISSSLILNPQRYLLKLIIPIVQDWFLA